MPEVKPPKRLSDDEFQAQKEAYIAKYGYSVYLPGWSDIIHLTPVSWKSKEEQKAYKKKAFLRMLSSPTPQWFKSYASFAKTCDNIEDGLVTAVVLGRFGAHFAPRIFARFVPILGWALLGADILNLFNLFTWLPMLRMERKRAWDGIQRRNPFGAKAKAKRLEKLKRLRPTIGEMIEVAQTTDELFGVGISFGPLLGLISDTFFGVARTIAGEKVRWKGFDRYASDYEITMMKAVRDASVVCNQGQLFSDEFHTKCYITAAMCMYALLPTLCELNPYDLEGDIFSHEIEAPNPEYEDTRAIITEAGLDPENGIAWPQTGKRFDNCENLFYASPGTITSNFWEYSQRTKYTYEGYYASRCVDATAKAFLWLMSDDGAIESSLDPMSQMLERLIRNDIHFVPRYPEEAMSKLWDWFNVYVATFGGLPITELFLEKARYFKVPYSNSPVTVPIGTAADLYPELQRIAKDLGDKGFTY
jgi:hypothetical protein